MTSNIYKIYHKNSKCYSKEFHIVTENKKIIEGQMLSSNHYSGEELIDKDVEIKIIKYNKNKIDDEIDITIPSNKLKMAYNEIQKQSKSSVFLIKIVQQYEKYEENYSLYIDFHVYPSRTNKSILLTLPTFKIEYFN
tara:strand:+ start:106 stop:516 length:411 start_codon:yes stop_codon:yes gene_type:complete